MTALAHPRLLVALDFAQPDTAEDFAAALDPRLCRLKVGKELFTRGGPQLVERLQAQGFSVFLDLKFHDIPNTVAAACRAARDLGVWMVNVHALGGPEMLAAARDAVGEGADRPLLTAVTVLTSHDASTLEAIGLQGPPEVAVNRLAALAHSARLDGVVCSAQEACALSAHWGEGFLRVTPGIRPADSGADDQRRTATPAAAIRAGAHYLVVGRPITQARNPAAVVCDIDAQIRAAV